jgi:hypothetical protein
MLVAPLQITPVEIQQLVALQLEEALPCQHADARGVDVRSRALPISPLQ